VEALTGRPRKGHQDRCKYVSQSAISSCDLGSPSLAARIEREARLVARGALAHGGVHGRCAVAGDGGDGDGRAAGPGFPNLDIRRKTLDIALDLITPRNIDEVVLTLKKEVVKTQNRELEKGGETARCWCRPSTRAPSSSPTSPDPSCTCSWTSWETRSVLVARPLRHLCRNFLGDQVDSGRCTPQAPAEGIPWETRSVLPAAHVHFQCGRGLFHAPGQVSSCPISCGLLMLWCLPGADDLAPPGDFLCRW